MSTPAPDRALPAYQQLYEKIRAQIIRGDMPSGQQLPTVREGAIRWGLSPGTVQRAYLQLSNEGLTESRPGHQGGTFVSAVTPRNSQDDYQTGRETGKIYGGTRKARVLSAEVIPATPDVARMLHLNPGDLVVRRERVTYPSTDDPEVKPVSASVSYHDAALLTHAPRLTALERIPQGTPSYIEENTGYVGKRVVDIVSAQPATEDWAEKLGIPAGSPVLLMRTTLSTDDDTVIEYGVCVTPPGAERVFRSQI